MGLSRVRRRTNSVHPTPEHNSGQKRERVRKGKRKSEIGWLDLGKGWSVEIPDDFDALRMQ